MEDINNHLSDQFTGLKVDVKRLDDLNDLPQAHIIKIDTELEDYNVLLGAQRFLQSQCLKAIILEYNKSELQKVINGDLLGTLKGLGCLWAALPYSGCKQKEKTFYVTFSWKSYFFFKKNYCHLVILYK